MRKYLQSMSLKIKIVIACLMLFLPLTLSAEDFRQPIDFSHKTHAGVNKIPCEFCHIYARQSASSGIPPVVTCYHCHSVISGTEDKQKKEIEKLLGYWERQQPIPWKKIHDVPDFVHFSHKRHIKVGFDCTECHGDISKLDIITMDDMKADLSMGWCVDCHIEKHPSSKGKVIKPARETRGGPVIKNAKTIQPDGTLQGSKDCFICHK